MQETRVWSLGREDPLEKEMATHSSILTWKIPWTEEPSRLYSPWGHKESDTTECLTHTHINPTLYLGFYFEHCFHFLEKDGHIIYFSSVQSLSCVRLFVTPWTAACQASLSITNCRSLPKFMSIESVMPSYHIILCRPLLLPSIFPNIRIFSNESALRIRWPKYWSFSFNVSPSNE